MGGTCGHWRELAITLLALNFVSVCVVLCRARRVRKVAALLVHGITSVTPSQKKRDFAPAVTRRASASRGEPRSRSASADGVAGDDDGPNDWEIAWKEIKLGRKIAAGAFGTVYTAQWMGTEVAVKVPLFRASGARGKGGDGAQHTVDTTFLREVRLMSSMHHPNIVVFLGACITAPNVCVLMEYLPRGSVHDYLRRPDTDRLGLGTIVKFAIDVSRGMSYLHRRCKIIQRDLKSHNLLLDNYLNVKVCDFGLSRVAKAGKTHAGSSVRAARGGGASISAMELTACGTPLWSAPEVIRSQPYNEKADVYSFGIVLTELFSQKTPYHDSDKPPLEIAYHVAEFGMRPDIPAGVPGELCELTEACLAATPAERPAFVEVTRVLQAFYKHAKERRQLDSTIPALALARAEQAGVGGPPYDDMDTSPPLDAAIVPPNALLPTVPEL
eukprot:g3497.t1